jgi:hypothetical protein
MNPLDGGVLVVRVVVGLTNRLSRLQAWVALVPGAAREYPVPSERAHFDHAPDRHLCVCSAPSSSIAPSGIAECVTGRPRPAIGHASHGGSSVGR